MAYKLKDREGMATGIRRIVAEELEQASDELEGRGDPDPDEAVHEARKRLKKARTALRLVRDDVGADLQRAENAALREAQHRLSGARDAQVLLETLDALAATGDGRLPESAVRGLREALQAGREHARRDERGQRAQAVAELAAVRERADAWPLTDEGFASASQGLRRIYRRGRKARDAALAGGDDERWHDWRKRVKDLWYAARILRPVAPVQLKALVDEADELADVLGEHNDLAVLRRALDEHAAKLEAGQVELLRAALDERRAELRRRADPLGRRLYAEPPNRFVARLAAYWEARPAQWAAEAPLADGTARVA